jgi:sulfate adenylyltransferase subunit 2
MLRPVNAALIAELTEQYQQLDLPERLMTARRAIGGRIVFTTSFGIEDQAITHVVFTAGLDIDVVTFDTGRLFPETLDVWGDTERRYGRQIRAFCPDRDGVERIVERDGVGGFRRSLEGRLACCAVRKVQPLGRALAGASAWITGLRADQSPERAQISCAGFDLQYRIIKLNPLFDWTRDRVVAFLRDRGVPYNLLHDRGFLSIGCAPCTRAVAPGETERAGRWWWEQEEKTECGLHASRPGCRSGPALSQDASALSEASARPADRGCSSALKHLQQVEAESIHIIREAVAQSDNPVMLYSIGKDSSVLLHLAEKAFYPGKLPFPLLHIDTTWKFRDMIAFRDKVARRPGRELIVHVNASGFARGIGPISHGSAIHTDVMKTQALRQALDKYRFDAALGGARRDEESSRAKERVFSFRNGHHYWDPKRQRPEPWRLYNGLKRKGESIRVFPLSNWTELDIWLYIHQEQIPVVPLYFAAARPVVHRRGMLIMVDDDRLPLEDGEQPEIRTIRFRTLGCYPLSGAVESTATTVAEIIGETLHCHFSERHGRGIDHDSAASMERKKREGYF